VVILLRLSNGMDVVVRASRLRRRVQDESVNNPNPAPVTRQRLIELARNLMQLMQSGPRDVKSGGTESLAELKKNEKSETPHPLDSLPPPET
jgi:hypothetical protein